MAINGLIRQRPVLAFLCLLSMVTFFSVNPSESVAAVYYVANNGDDANDGISPWTPFRTLYRANLSVRNGDTVLLRRGDIFREFADFTDKTITLTYYGSDQLPRPVIAGSIVLKNWQPYYPKPSAHEELMEKLNGLFVPSQKTLPVCGLNVQAGSGPMKGWSKNKASIFVTTAGDQKVENLFVDGKMMLIARYPNAGQGAASWLRIKDGTSNNQIVDADLTKHPRNAADYWKGANVRWRKWSWWFETLSVTSYDASGRLSLSGKHFEESIAPKPGWGYYLDNKLDELDAPGEWYFDPAEKKVYLWAPEGADPNKLLVEGACIAKGAGASGKLEGIEFRHQTQNGASFGGPTTVNGCKFVGQGDTGLASTFDSSGSKVTNCIFEDILNTSFNVLENPAKAAGTEINNNTFTRCGMVPGYGGSGPWHSNAITVVAGKGIKIHHNNMEYVGYVGILFGSEGNFADCNIIKHAMATLNDGGAIYTNCHRSTIRNNIILESEGNLESSGPWYNLGQGIWPEFLSDFKEQVIENNTVAGCGCNGIFLPNNYDSTIAGNILYNNGRSQLHLSGKRNSNHKIEKNVIFACSDKQAGIQFEDTIDYGSLKGNYLCASFGPPIWGKGGAKMSVRDWQGKYSWSDKEPKGEAISGMGFLFINDTTEVKDFPLPRYQWMDLDGKAVGSTIKLEPYTSKILILCGVSGAQQPKYYLYSELKKAEIAAAAAKPAASKPAAAAAEAQPEYKPKPVVTEKLATMEDWVSKLRYRISLYLKSGQKPKFRCAAIDSKVTLESMDDAGQIALTDRDGKKTSLTWDKLTLDDYINIAQDMAGMTDSALDHALLAYFCHAAKKTDKAQEHLKKAGSYEKAVKDATGL